MIPIGTRVRLVEEAVEGVIDRLRFFGREVERGEITGVVKLHLGMYNVILTDDVRYRCLAFDETWWLVDEDLEVIDGPRVTAKDTTYGLSPIAEAIYDIFAKSYNSSGTTPQYSIDVSIAIVGDDRPAPNGDEFETTILNVLAEEQRLNRTNEGGNDHDEVHDEACDR